MQDLNYKVLKLSKENLKFSAAHFLIFDETRAERLHGHNYGVQIEFCLDWSIFESIGYGLDFGPIKSRIKAILDEWDERVLLPAKRQDMTFNVNGDSLEVLFRERRYVFPRNEVILLPIVNTSVELLSGLICDQLWGEYKAKGILGIKVQVEETKGQAALSTQGKW